MVLSALFSEIKVGTPRVELLQPGRLSEALSIDCDGLGAENRGGVGLAWLVRVKRFGAAYRG